MCLRATSRFPNPENGADVGNWGDWWPIVGTSGVRGVNRNQIIGRVDESGEVSIVIKHEQTIL